MEDAVKDAIAAGKTKDTILAILLDVTIPAVREGRPLFPNPLDEPVFYRRYFKRWVKEGLEEAKLMDKALEEARKSVSSQD